MEKSASFKHKNYSEYTISKQLYYHAAISQIKSKHKSIVKFLKYNQMVYKPGG